MSNVAERVAAGAALLDENVPGWHAMIDVETLVVRNVQECILGQLFRPTSYEHYSSGYDRALNILELSECDCCAKDGESSPAYGFTIEDGANVDSEFNALQEEWERLIALRLAV
jgi:hypothetical protein